MQIHKIAQEAQLLYGSLPMLNTLQGTERIGFLDYLMLDLAKIALFCGDAHGTFNVNESDAAKLIMHGLGVIYQGGTVQQAIFSIKNWTRRNIFDKQVIETVFQSILNTARQNNIHMLVLPQIVKQMDKQYGYTWFDKFAHAMYRFAEVIVKADGTVTEEEKQALKQVRGIIYGQDFQEEPQRLNAVEVKKVEKIEKAVQPSKETLKQVMTNLDDLIGLENIKEEVRTLTNFLKIQKKRMKRGMKKTPFSLHAVFSGPPGTGKTTVARLLAKIFRHLGFIQSGHLLETDRAGLVAGYIGQTTQKTNEVVKKAMGGILFIDEAYALQPEGSPNDYGHEAVSTILKRMEDHRDKFVVIVAGYTQEMKKFVETNPGLKSRFNRYFYFDHYKPDKLLAIFEKFCRDANYKTTAKAKSKVRSILKEKYASRDRTFGNARFARNLFEKTIANQANRIANIAPITDKILTTITEEDIKV